jgi:hypothetical protein
MPAPASRTQVLVISERVYRGLLAAYPAEFRQRYGAEMAQVFRTCCRASFDSWGVSGVLDLWLPTLWDWAWSAAGERFSSLFRRSKMYNIHPRRASSSLIPVLLFLNACLLLLFVSPCSLFFDFLYKEYCWTEVDNQFGETLRVTPLDTDNPLTPIRLYGSTYPAYQQRDISVKSGERVTLSYDCDRHDVSEVYACDLDGECYIQTHYVTRDFRVFTFQSLDSLSRPDAALEAAVQSFPEHNYSTLRIVLLCMIQLIFFIGGVYWLVRARTVEIPKHDI